MAPEMAKAVRRKHVYRRPVGRWIEWLDVKRQELSLRVHVQLRGSPTAWNVIRHLKNSVKMAGSVKTGQECEKSTLRSTPRGWKMEKMSKCEKGHED